ncbi:MAG: peroxiredoxin [Saprospiraceae bacterium]
MRQTWTSKWKPGQNAPSFKAITHESKEISSALVKGKRYILFFYNHDDSETCTKEACQLRDHFELLTSKGFTIIGVSEDSINKHQKFIAKYNLPYLLISDKGNKLARLFDIYGKKDFMGRISDAVHRTTFVISAQGKIEAVIHPVDSGKHTQQILQTLNILV